MTVKSLVASLPGGEFAGYFAKTFWRQVVVDGYRTRRHRRAHAEAAAIAARAHELERDGCVLVPSLFSDVQMTALRAECRAMTKRVDQGAVNPKDVQIIPGGAYRLTWRPEYGETVEREFFHHPYFAAVARFYLGGPVEHVYKIFQRSVPGASKDYFGAGEHFHFDYERRTFKAFLYLTDVAAENGPLVYCKGTSGMDALKLSKIAQMHVTGSNKELECSPGEARRLALHDRATALTGPAGTVLLADTRGWHKAGHISAGIRDVLVLYYARA